MYTYMLLYYVKLFWYTILMQWQCFLLCFMIDWIWCYPKLDAWYNNQIYIYIYGIYSQPCPSSPMCGCRDIWLSSSTPAGQRASMPWTVHAVTETARKGTLRRGSSIRISHICLSNMTKAANFAFQSAYHGPSFGRPSLTRTAQESDSWDSTSQFDIWAVMIWSRRV